MQTATVRRALIVIITAVMMNAEVAWADCYSEKQRIEAHLQQMMNKMNSSGSTGFCEIARSIKRNYPQILNFYDRCPIVDPDRSMRDHVRQMLDWAGQVERSVCN